MRDKLVKSIGLENGLELNVYDASRRIGADTFLVKQILRIEIEVTKDLFAENEISNYDELKSLLGEKVVFEKKTERNFISDTENNELFDEILESYLNTSKPYLSHKDFPRKFVLKEFADRKSGKKILF